MAFYPTYQCTRRHITQHLILNINICHADRNVCSWNQRLVVEVGTHAQQLVVPRTLTQNVRMTWKSRTAVTWSHARAPVWSTATGTITAVVAVPTIPTCAGAVPLQCTSRANVLELTAMRMTTETALILVRTPITILYLAKLWQHTDVHYEMSVVYVSAVCNDPEGFHLSYSRYWSVKTQKPIAM
jgi:hypothetical protein